MYGTGKKLSKPKTQKQSEENIIESIRNLFILKKENEEIKRRKIRYIRTLFEQEYNYYKPERVSNFWNHNYIEYGSNGDRNKNLSLKEYLDKIKPYLKDIIIDLKESDTWKISVNTYN